VYLNSAKYLKVGQSVWVDRPFANGVINGMYSFHASASAFMEFWNNTVWKRHSGQAPKLSHHQVWQAFVQESIHSIASLSGLNLELEDGLSIHAVTKQAFGILGERGIIRSAEVHECSECTHEYKERSDRLGFYADDATVGMDEHAGPMLPQIQGQGGPPMGGDDAEMVDILERAGNSKAKVRMVVLDGIVMGPNVSFQCLYLRYFLLIFYLVLFLS